MMSTLTWGFKPIQLPKLNSNLLAVVSMILLFTMAFLTASVIAEHCDLERRTLKNEESDLRWLSAAAVTAELLWVAALTTFNFLAIAGATAAKLFALQQVAYKAEAVSIAREALYRCEQEHKPPPVSSGSDSGGCNS